MFKKKPDYTADNLDKEINALLLDMYTMNRKTDAEYPKMVELLTKLYAQRETAKPMSADVKATIAANLAGILILVHHEKAHVITSKAIGFVQKLR